jgi:hypothetical protein
MESKNTASIPSPSGNHDLLVSSDFLIMARAYEVFLHSSNVCFQLPTIDWSCVFLAEPVTRLITILGASNAPSIKHPIAVLWLNELKSMLLVDAEHHCVHLVNCDTGLREKESVDEFISHLSAQSISRVCEGLNRPSAIVRHTNVQRCPDIFIADTGNNRIQSLTFNLGGATSVRTLSGGSRRGYKDGPAAEAMFSSPSGLACAPVAPYMFIADTGNHAIRRIHLISGVVETIAGGSCGHRDGRAGHAKFNSPTGLAIDPEGLLYVADTGNHCIRIVHPDGLVQTLAGGGAEGATAGCVDGMRLEALFSLPRDVCIMMRTSMAHPNQKHSVILVADSGNGLIRQINHDGTLYLIHQVGCMSDSLFALQAAWRRSPEFNPHTLPIHHRHLVRRAHRAHRAHRTRLARRRPAQNLCRANCRRPR